jgi:hypothetical protein
MEGVACLMCHRTIESAGFRNLSGLAQRQRSTYKEQETRPDWEPATNHTLQSPGPETDWYSELLHARLQTSAWPDFSRPWVVCNSSKTKRKGGGVSRVTPLPDL